MSRMQQSRKAQKTQIVSPSVWESSQKSDPRGEKTDWKWKRGITTHPLSESQWVMSHFSVRKWESDSIRAGVVQRLSGSRCYGWYALGCCRKMGVRVDGQWCSGIMLKNWDFCTGCRERWKQGSRYSVLSRRLS